VATLALVIVTPLMVSSAVEIATLTGLGTGFIGTTLVALTTSLPEMVTTVAAGRIGAYDLAVGNLFGSNIFNILTLGLADVFFLGGRFITGIDAHMVMVGVMGLVLTTLGMIGILAHIERRSFMLQINALMVIGYLVGMVILFT
jgi:cation:H+ antiporter